MYQFFGKKPVHHTLAYHWARLIECLFCSEAVLDLARDPEIVSREVRTLPAEKPSAGGGVVEAARGTLYHHYTTDARGIVESVNLIVATGQNNPGMNMSIREMMNDADEDGDGAVGTVSDDDDDGTDPGVGNARLVVTAATDTPAAGQTTLTSAGRSGDARRTIDSILE